MPYSDREQQLEYWREYSRNRRESRREYQRNYQREWQQKRRQVALAGKTCAYCGSTERLEFHHLDPSQKSDRLARLWSRRQDIIDSELAKCIVLCHDCHDAVTHQQRQAA